MDESNVEPLKSFIAFISMLAPQRRVGTHFALAS